MVREMERLLQDVYGVPDDLLKAIDLSVLTVAQMQAVGKAIAAGYAHGQ